MTELVSVILATRNRAASLQRALASIQRQTHPNLEILVLDDGSTDGTFALLEKIAAHDQRLRILRNETSLGLASALNQLIDASQGVYLARMDDDDWAYPQRLERQIAYLEAHDLDVCGSWYRRIAGWRRSTMRPPTEPEVIQAELLFQPPLLHPSVLMRKVVLERHGGYRTDYPHAEDYELWTRLAPCCRLGNVPLVLMDYRLAASQVSRQHNASQSEAAQRIRQEYLRRLGIPHDTDEATRHARLRAPQPIDTLVELELAGEWLGKLASHFPQEIRSVFSRQWFLCAVRAAGLGRTAYRLWASSALAADAPPLRRAMLWSLCTLRLRYRSAPYRWLEPLVSG